MRSSLKGFLVIIITLLNLGCGVFGEKLAALRSLAFSGSSMACLDGFAEKLARYKEGKLSEAEWSTSMDCLNGNLENFQKLVRPSDPTGYSVDEMRLFVSRFLLTTGPVSEELVRAGFELKAALLGGSTSRISEAELEVLLSNLRSIKAISLDVLRELQGLGAGASDDALLRFSAVSRQAGERMAELLPAEAYASFSTDSIRTLIDECRRFGIDLDPALADTAIAAKILFLGGDPASIEPDAWRGVARMLGRLAGPFWIATQIPVDLEGKAFYERRAVFSGMIQDVQGVITDAMSQHQGKWSLTLLDRLIDAAPSAWVPWNRAVLKRSLRPMATRFLRASEPEVLRPGGVSILMGLADRWSRGASHVNAIFRRVGRDSVAWQNLIDFTVEYVAEISDLQSRQDAERLLGILRDYQPIWAQGDTGVRFQSFQEYSKDQLTLLNLSNLMAVHFIESYSSDPITSRHHINKADLTAFFGDFLPLAGEFKILDPTALDVADKRFRDMDLFTLASDGDGRLSEREITYFLLFASSIGGLSQKIADVSIPHCPVVAPDPFGTSFVDVACFETHYFGATVDVWDHFPGLQSFYSSISSSAQQAVQSQMAIAARRYGDSDQPVGAFDIQGYAGLSHYVESLMYRFDRDRNGVLVLDEVMLAFPMFKKLLAELGGLDPGDTGTLEAVFTYIVKYQKIPKKDAHFIWWFLTKPFWKVEASRSALFNLIAQVSKPEPLPPQQ